MYAPFTANAVALLVFWCVIYGQNAYRTGKIGKTSSSNSLSGPNL